MPHQCQTKRSTAAPAYEGIAFQRASSEMLERAHRATKRTNADRLAAKLDALLGTVDDDLEQEAR